MLDFLATTSIRHGGSRTVKSVFDTEFDQTQGDLGPNDDPTALLGGAPVPARNEADGEGGKPKEWFAQTATSVQALSAKLRGALYGTKIMSWFSEWCDTPMRPTPGMVYRDACYLYDSNG